MDNLKPIRVVIVEDYALVRVGLVALLRQDPSIEMLGEAENAEDGLTLIKSLHPDVVLMDLGLPMMNGIEATTAVKAFNPEIKVIILTSHEKQDEVVAALGAGANAYCLKDIPSNRLIEVIKTVSEGAAWLDPAIAAAALEIFMQAKPLPALNTGQMGDAPPPIVPLAGRETEVLKLLVQGKNNAEIAENLFVSVHTVKAHVSNILQKLSVSDRVQAAVRAVQEGMV